MIANPYVIVGRSIGNTVTDEIIFFSLSGILVLFTVYASIKATITVMTPLTADTKKLLPQSLQKSVRRKHVYISSETDSYIRPKRLYEHEQYRKYKKYYKQRRLQTKI